MMRRLIAVVAVLGFAAALVGCTASGGDSSQEAETQAEQPTSPYQEVLDEYTVQLQEATPELIAQFNEEAPALGGDTTKLYDLFNEKNAELLKICTKATNRMGAIRLENGDDDKTIEEWVGKLTEVYTAESAKLAVAYQDACSDAVIDNAVKSNAAYMQELTGED